MAPDWAALHDIMGAARRIRDFSVGLDRSSLETDRKSRSAILYELIVIGEATKRLSRDFRTAHPVVDWTKIAGTRDRLTHGYDRVKFDVVWEIITRSIPELIEALEPLIPTSGEAEVPGALPDGPEAEESP